MRSILLRSTRSFYSTAPPQKKNIFRLPLKHQFTTQALAQTTDAIVRSRSCNILAVTFRDNISSFTDTHLHQLYNHLHTYKLQIDNSFHQIIAPISLQYLKVFTREQTITMYQMLTTMLDLKIDNPTLKNAILNKLDNENCYKYIPLYESVVLLNKLLENQQDSKLGLTNKLITVLYQQKQYYNYFIATRPIVGQVLKKLENLKREQPQLTEAYKQLN